MKSRKGGITIMIGTIKKKTDRGFGFISPQGDGQDLFFHSSALVGVAFDALQEGAAVTFDVETGNDGRQKAANVKLADEGAQSAPAEEMQPSEPVEEAVEPAETAEETAPAETVAEEPATT